MSPEYVHGYGTREQQRLVEQAEHWRHRLIADGTELPPGTRLLEIGSGVGAVLAVLGQEFRLDDMRSLPDSPGAGIGWVVHKSTALR